MHHVPPFHTIFTCTFFSATWNYITNMVYFHPVLSYYVSLHSEFFVAISAWKRCAVRLYLPLIIGWLMSFFTLFVFVFALWCPTRIVLCFFFCLSSSCVLCWYFLWIVHLWLPLLYSLMFINKYFSILFDYCPSIFLYNSSSLDVPLDLVGYHF